MQEYDLYWEFARSRGLWKRHHRHAVLQRSAMNVWLPEQYKVQSFISFPVLFFRHVCASPECLLLCRTGIRVCCQMTQIAQGTGP